MSNAVEPVLQASHLVKCYDEGPTELEVLRGVNLTVEKGDILAIIGASGSGKSTLLNLLGGLDTATRGKVTIAGNDLSTLNERGTGRLRNRYLGFVYQFHHLLPEFTALENVMLPCALGGMAPRQARPKAEQLLQRVGLGERLRHKPGE